MQDHSQPIQRNIMLVLGLQGQGKTSLCRLILRRVRRAVVIDDHEEFEDGVRVRSLADLVDYLTRNAGRPYRVLYSSPTLLEEPDRPGSEFDRLCSFLHAIPDQLIIINEVALFTSPSKIAPAFSRLLTQGRRQFIDILATVRRKTETHNILTSQANVLVSFKQTLPDDVRYMREHIGEMADQIPNLGMLEYVYWTPRGCGRDRIDFNAPKIDFLKTLDMNGIPMLA